MIKRPSQGPPPGRPPPVRKEESPDGDTEVITKTRTKKKLEKPKLYKVILHNDDYTTMEFVVAVLKTIFHKSESDSTAIMLHVHMRGAGVAGVYTYEVAEEKVARTLQLAQEAEYPLLCTLEPE